MFFVYLIRDKKWTFTVRSQKNNHVEDFQKEVNVLITNDTTKFLLGIADPPIKIKTGVCQNDDVIRFSGVLDYKPLACPKRGIINETQIIIYG